MNMKKFLALFLFSLFLLPVPALAQCRDQLCQNLQNILYAAVTDFREYRKNLAPGPDVSVAGARIPCRMTAWANNVPMYMCYAQVPDASAESWYINALASLRLLQPAWHFRIESSVADHFVDAGPPDCTALATEGPYVGHCPLHLQTTKQNDGTSKIYLWMSSLSSPYLVARPPGPPSVTAPSVVSDACDDLCQGLKKALEARLHAFAGIRAGGSNGDGVSGVAGVTDKLPGAAECSLDTVAKSHASEIGTQYVCYWRETSSAAADKRFADLISRLQVLVPSAWTMKQEDELEELSGAKVSAWSAVAPDGKQQVSIYVSSTSVGLHIKAWN